MSFPFKHPSFYLIIVFLMLSIADIFREYSAGESMNHLAFEIVVCLCATTWAVHLFVSWLRTKEKLRSEIKEKLDINNEYQAW